MLRIEVLAMSKQQLIIVAMSLVSASFALRDRKALDDARAKFAATFPDDAAALVLDTVGEVVEAS
jgi:hypothetical protein